MKKFFVLLIVLAILGGAGYYFYNNMLEEVPVSNEDLEISQEVEKPEIKIFSGNDRPIAIMTDNNVNAQPQSNLNLAYIVYEIIVEGKETRLMPVFKGVPDDTVLGPVRSVRHYFIDYMNENDAVCAHLGQSPQAESDIKIFKMDDINGQAYDTGRSRTSTSLFWREQHKNAPHNAYTSIGSLRKIMEDRGYDMTSDAESVLNYVTEEVTLDTEDDLIANSVTIPYSSSHKVKYVYDEETGRYTRYSKGRLQKDEATGEEVTTKNIIITYVYNYTLDDGEGKGRQTLNNVGEAVGYYITNGKAQKIMCKKDSRTSPTVYVDYFGNEIKVNDGNTFINICPVDAEIVFE